MSKKAVAFDFNVLDLIYAYRFKRKFCKVLIDRHCRRKQIGRGKRNTAIFQNARKRPILTARAVQAVYGAIDLAKFF